MADEAVKTDETNVVAPEAPTPTPNPLETTTAKDGSLPININTTVPTPEATPNTPSPTPAPAVTAPETPILVTESEVSNPTPASSNPEGLAEEVEGLSGEIQALEAKIDRLTGNVKPVTETTKSTPTEPAKEESPATPPAESFSVPPVSTSEPQTSKPESKTVAVNDIYSKSAERQKEAQLAETAKTPDMEEAEEMGSGSGIGIIGEVLSVFGVIIFMLLGASPFYKSFLSTDIMGAVRSIGWPTAVVSLAIGFLLSLFVHGKAMTKIFTLIILLVAVVLYLGVAGYQNFLGPLGPMLDSIFSFYR